MKTLDVLPAGWEEEIEGDSPDGFSEEARAANMLRALANPHRLKILRLLNHAPHTVMDLCEQLGLRQSLASQHLARLRVDGIVAAERQGHHVIYSLENAKARDILAILDGERPRALRSRGRKKRLNGQASSGAAAKGAGLQADSIK
jgi:ArsR family transcriptional regulator, virulence genes transcriptional regulator